MWTDSTRAKYARDGLRYATDLTDAEFALIAPHLPSPRPVGRPPQDEPARGHRRHLVCPAGGLARGACRPQDFPPWQAVYGYIREWRIGGLWARLHHALVLALREVMARAASPRAAIIDSQSVQTTQSGGPHEGRLSGVEPSFW